MENKKKKKKNERFGKQQKSWSRSATIFLCHLGEKCLPAGQGSPHWKKKGFLKRFTALCYIRYLAFASHLLLLAIRAKKRNKEVGRVDRAKRGWRQRKMRLEMDGR